MAVVLHCMHAVNEHYQKGRIAHVTLNPTQTTICSDFLLLLVDMLSFTFSTYLRWERYPKTKK